MKNIIDEQESDLTSLNHLMHASTVIITELCNVKITQNNVLKKCAWQERIQKQINTLHLDLEKLKNAQNQSNVNISKSRKLRTTYEIKHPEEIQTTLEKNKTSYSSKS